jgi:hypothetical protein
MATTTVAVWMRQNAAHRVNADQKMISIWPVSLIRVTGV